MSSMKSIFINSIIMVFSLLFSLMAACILVFNRIRKGSSYLTIKTRSDPPPILHDSKWGSHHYVFLPKQRIRLHYVEKGNRANPLMLCLHGFPDCWFTWRNTLEEFSSQYWVVAVDMRGYGDSDKPEDVKSYKLDHLIEDIREFLQLLGKERCTLIAHDWGGVLGWMVTSKYPELFDKHISLNGPHVSALLNHAFSSVSQLMKSWYIVFFQSWYVPEALFRADDLAILDRIFRKAIVTGHKLTDDELEAYKYYYSKKGAISGPLNYYRNLDFTATDSSHCSVDSLIVWGCQDSALDREIVDKTFDYCDKLQVRYINDSGHCVLQEKPKEVHEHIWKFLKN